MSKSLGLTFIPTLILLLGCQPSGVENPAAKAEYVTEQKLSEEYAAANDKDCRDMEVKEAQKKLEALNHFLIKYDKPIRVRYKNGNLALRDRNEELLGKLLKQRDICTRFIEDRVGKR